MKVIFENGLQIIIKIQNQTDSKKDGFTYQGIFRLKLNQEIV